MIDPENIDILDSDSDYGDEEIEFHDMEIFCHSISEPHLVEPLKNHKVTLYQLLNFDEKDLINCGIDKVGDRKKILDSIAQAHCEQWVPTSINDLTAKNFMTGPGIYITANDMNKHEHYMGLNVAYIRRQLKIKPEILELGKDYVGVGKIISEMEDFLETSKWTQNQIVSLLKELKRKAEDPVFQPANNIDEKYICKGNKMKMCVLPVILGGAVLCVANLIEKIL